MVGDVEWMDHVEQVVECEPRLEHGVPLPLGFRV